MIPETAIIQITKQTAIGGNTRFLLIAGPCVIESEEISLAIAEELCGISENLNLSLVFKASFDKANRSSLSSFRGPGLEKGLEILARIKERFLFPVITDIHLPEQAIPAAEVADIIQIPAFLCRQTDIIIAAAETGKPLNVKKGQFLSPAEVDNIITKASESGNQNLMITERGTFFGYNRLVNDFAGIETIRSKGTPVIFDATHSVQEPGGKGSSSGGVREYAPLLARSAAAAGIDGLFLETHPDPDSALCDGPNMIRTSELEEFLKPLIEIDSIVKNI